MLKNARFVKSVGSVAQLTEFFENEVAVVGRSNVGKSSLINFLCGNNKLARVGKEPGKTRLINYFGIDGNKFYLVDLPGYGFAKVSDAEKAKWGELIESYLQRSIGLKQVFVLVDVRHDPTDDDKQMLNYLYYYRIPFTVIATKCDKISRPEYARRRQAIASVLGIGVDNVLMCSAQSRLGLEDLCRKIENSFVTAD